MTTIDASWIQTRTRRKFWPIRPDVKDVDIIDIAHSLANTCRFAGHCRTFYSVAEHSVRIVRYLRKLGYSNTILLSALFHDGSEAYICDLPRPIKILPEFLFYKEIEHRLMVCLAEKFGFMYPLPQPVKYADNRLLSTEAAQLMNFPINNWHLSVAEPIQYKIRTWSPRKAKREFIREYREINGLRNKSRVSEFFKCYWIGEIAWTMLN